MDREGMREAGPTSANVALVEAVRGAPAALFQFRLSPSCAYALPFASPDFVARYGIEQGEPEETAARFFSRVHPDDLDPMRDAIARSAKSLETFEMDFRFRDAAGAEVWVEARSKPERTADGGVIWNGIATDITARKAAELALRQSERQFRAVLDTLQDSYFRTDLEGRFVILSPSTAKMYGYSLADELIGEPTRVLYGDPEEQDRVMAEIREKGFVRDRSGLGRRKDGSTLWVSLNAQPWFDEQGRPAGMEGVARDITARMDAEAALRESEERFRAMFDLAPVGIAQADPATGRLLVVNPKLCLITGYPADELLTMSASEITHPEDRERDWELFQSVVKGEAPEYWMEKRFVRKDGSSAWVNVNMVVLRDAAGRPARTVATIEDITERKRAETNAVRLNAELEEALAWQRQIFEGSRDAVFLSDEQGRFVAVNHAATELTGFSREELLAMRIPDLHDEPDLAAYRAFHRRILDGDWILSEASIRKKDGGKVFVEFNNSLVVISGRRLMHTAGRDITERKRAEEALRASEEELRATFELAPVGVAQTEPGTGRFLRVNPKMCAITGYSAMELLTMSVSELTHPEDRDRDGKLFERVVRGEAPEYQIEKRYVRKDNSVAWVNVNMIVLRDDAGAPVRTVGIIEDITERKRFAQRVAMQAAIGRVLAEAATLAEAMPRILRALGEGEGFAFGAWWEKDADSTSFRCVNTWSADPARTAELENQSRVLVAARGVGVPGKVWETGRVVHENRLGPGFPRAEAAARAGVPAALAFPLLLRGEMAGVLEFFAAEIPEVDPTLIETLGGQIGLYLERKRAEEASARFLAGSPAVIYALRLAPGGFRASWFSENIHSLTGYTYAEVRAGNPQRWWEQGIHADDLQRVVTANQAVLDEGHAMVEFRFRRKDGIWIWLHDEKRVLFDPENRPSEVVGSWMDVTARVRLEEQLRQSQKMEAIGQLAGGVAHDFNNLLTVISGNTDLLLSDMPTDDPRRAALADVRAAGERAANLTRQLLAFSRKQILEPKLVDVHEVVSGIEKMLRRLIGEDVELLTDLAADPSWVKVDPGQLEQVVMNLAMNARDAMPRGGRLTIRTRNVDPKEPVDLEETAGRQLRPKVAISISDAGIGISPEVKAHLFEPFFTTKGVGKGTGLGLATVFGIVKQSGGDITVESEPGKGATFTVILPSQPGPRRRGGSGASLRAVPRGTETVLVVEDEDAVRRIVKIALESAGYRVIEARNGPEALEAARTHSGEIQLVVTDVVMPKMSGRELVERIVKDHPGVRILYMSGYTDDAVVRHGIVESGVAFLQKPFTPLALARKVREVLDGKAPEN